MLIGTQHAALVLLLLPPGPQATSLCVYIVSVVQLTLGFRTARIEVNSSISYANLGSLHEDVRVSGQAVRGRLRFKKLYIAVYTCDVCSTAA